MHIHDDVAEVLITTEQIASRVAELGAAITHDIGGEPIMLVGILKGAVLFMADLARAIDAPLSLDFMAVSSYGNTMQSQGIVRILKDLDEPINDRHVVLVEDIIDTGLTLSYLLENLHRRSPASLRICTLLDKQKARVKYVEPDYTGFTIPDEFVVGYGLDYAQRYRNLPYIGILKPQVYRANNED